MTLQDKLKKIKDALVEVTGDCYHYTRPARHSVPYVVWQEDGADYFRADNRVKEYQLTGTIDIFSKQEFDPLFDAVMDAVNAVENASITLNSVQYEDENNLIHYEYSFTVA